MEDCAERGMLARGPAVAEFVVETEVSGAVRTSLGAEQLVSVGQPTAQTKPLHALRNTTTPEVLQRCIA
jgi:hypothetical protein